MDQCKPSELYTATVTVNVVGQIIADDDTLGHHQPLASGPTPVAQEEYVETSNKTGCRNDK
jgi:hypothetical protein